MAMFYNNEGQGITSRSMTSGYIFYENLRDVHPNIYEGVKSSLTNLANVNREVNNTEVANKLMQMSQAELQKEKRWLETVFGMTVPYDYSSPEGIQDIIETINACIGTKKIYERLIHRIRAGEAKINITQFFSGYFQTELNREENRTRIVEAYFSSKNKSGPQKIAAVKQIFEDMYMTALERMFNSNMFNKTSQKRQNYLADNNLSNEDKEYAELLKHIGDLSTTNSFAKQIYEMYNLDQVFYGILKTLHSTQKAKKKTRIEKLKGFSVTESKDGNVGTVEEYFTKLVFQSLEKTLSAKGIKVDSSVTGGTLVKPDIIAAFNIDLKPMIQHIENANGVADRARNVQLIEEGYKKLQSFEGKEGFLVYTNAKNYTLGKQSGFTSRGFSAGRSGSYDFLNTFLTKVSDNPKATQTLLGAAINTAKGAIGYHINGLSKTIETQLASDIAYFLFDDFEIVGTDSKTNLTQLHLMDLDGIYFPLSFFLYLLADSYTKATYEVTKNPTALVNVKLVHEPILYPKRPEQGWQPEMWEEQKIQARQWQVANVYFLRNFSEIVTQLLYKNK